MPRKNYSLLTLLFIAVFLLFPTFANATSDVARKSEASKPGTRIVDGDVAAINSWPSQVAVFPGDEYLCGGTLIDKEWILTAAHCLDIWGVSASNTPVVLGSKSLFGKTSRLKSMFIHPRYDWYSILNDVALLRLQNPSSLPTARLIKPTEKTLLQEGVPAYIVGWGTTCYQECSVSTVLREATVEMVANEVCSAAYKPSAFYNGIPFVPGNMICAGVPTGGIDSCQGDSGGPLEVGDGNGGRVLAGVVSWGEGCAEAEYPGVYADLTAQYNWISGYLSRSLKAPKRVAFRKKRKITITNTDNYPVRPRIRVNNRKSFKINKGCGSILKKGQSCSFWVKKNKSKRKKVIKSKILLRNSAGDIIRRIKITGKRY
jgi:secreted trypsin-like serine protease